MRAQTATLTPAPALCFRSPAPAPIRRWAEHGYPVANAAGSGVPLSLDVGALGARVFLSGVAPADVGAAERARRGWAPLPDLSTLPPYPGWTRSFNGFDFGQEQPGRGMARYDFTALNVEVLAA